MRFGTVALLGRTNVGKSTFLNSVLGEPLAITSPLPQTTRDSLLGVVTRDGYQAAFLDTPGLHRPRSELGRRMNGAALEAARSADVVALMTDAWQNIPKAKPFSAFSDPTPLQSEWIREGDADLIRHAQTLNSSPKVLLINKVDRAKDKGLLLPMIEAYQAALGFDAIVPMSARRGQGVEDAFKEIGKRLPEGPMGYEEDELTNRPVLFFVREYVREAILNQLRKEVPHAAAVSIDRADETEKLLKIFATIHIEKEGQRKILIGKGGAQIKEIGIAARERIEELAQKKVHLELFVRMTPSWKDMPRQLAELGYESTKEDFSLKKGKNNDSAADTPGTQDEK
ncbi:MAG: GTPase Era [Polyangiaceae bacterium]|nr:GTPase Era [Polyangiaceae bacterium]